MKSTMPWFCLAALLSHAAYADDGKVTIERKAISDLELKEQI